MISEKQKQIMAFGYTDYDALICDGAIRSGKTVFMIMSFIDWAMRNYSNSLFGICGKTIDSTIKNIIMPYLNIKLCRERYNVKWRKNDKLLIVDDGKKQNTFEVFGGKDESSFALIQGRTLSGVLLDEVALQPKSFVDQATGRCSVAGSKIWFNCNPASEQHWFYKEWILDKDNKNAYRIHFQLEDNPSLEERIIQRYKSMYTGVFYQRYILGEWCMAEGLIFDNWKITDFDYKEIQRSKNIKKVFGLDFGYTNDPTAFWCGLVDVNNKEIYVYDEIYKTGLQNDIIYKLISEKGYKNEVIIADSSEPKSIDKLRDLGLSRIRGARKGQGSVLAGIDLLQGYQILVLPKCENFIRELNNYVWEQDKAGKDLNKPLDAYNHLMDAMRYATEDILRGDVFSFI